jgi:hypothetical protein
VSDSLGRIIPRVPAATSSSSNLFEAKRALTSLGGHLVTSDLNHMGAEYAGRVLVTHPGWVGYWAGSPGNPTASGPEVSDIDWAGQGEVPGRTANACLGTHWVVPVGAGATYPRAVLRCRARAAVSFGSTAGIYFGVTPGRGAFPSATSSRARSYLTLSTFVDVRLTLQLRATDLGAWVTSPATGRTTSGTAPLADPVQLMCFTAWVGAYNSTNKNFTADDLTDLLGLSLSLEP